MQHDVVIVGGAFAGLAAATYLGRARRDVVVIDAGQPRNRFASASHGFLGFDGSDPRDILARARRQLATYPTVRVIDGEAVAAEATGGGFAVEPARLAEFVGDGPQMTAAILEDGRDVPVDALYVSPYSTLGSPIAAELGAAVEDGPLGEIVKTDAERKTTVPGLYAAGDIAHAPHSVSLAVADGATAALSVHRALVFG